MDSFNEIKLEDEERDQFQRSVWKQVKNETGEDWLLFFNNDPFHYCKDKKDESKTNLLVKTTDFNSKKNIALGSLVMTPNGIGKLIRQDKSVSTVKLVKTNDDVQVEESQVMAVFPIYIRILDKEFSTWHKIFLPATGNVEQLKRFLEEKKVVEKDKNFTIVFNACELKEEQYFDQIDLRSESKLLVYGLKSSLCRLDRFTKVNKYWYTYPTDGISFRVDKKIRLAGLGLYGSHDGKVQKCTLQIVEGDQTGTIKYEDSIEVPPGTQTEPYTMINFNKPVKLDPKGIYTIILKSTIYCNGYYGSMGQSEVTGEKNVKFTFSYTNSASFGSNISAGNFPILVYYA